MDLSGISAYRSFSGYYLRLKEGKMRGTINISGKEVEVAANAASPYIFKQIFHEDFLKKIQEKDPDEDIFQKMFFVMASQAKMTTPEALKLTFDNYMEFLDGFDPMEIIGSTQNITEFYFNQTFATSVPKGKGG